jgi:hypothetical protein
MTLYVSGATQTSLEAVERVGRRSDWSPVSTPIAVT